ncbi:MAG TPA: primosomal protein N' [Nocardioidaceae bacterium]|nr:primosomal protein N' [Nocardioidaceae bacterium]
MTEQKPDRDGQVALMPHLARTGARAARQRAASAPAPAAVAPERPVARVLVDIPLAHLDRPFDYLVPARLHDTVAPGSRVRVRFAGQDVEGFVLERVEASDHEGPLAPLRRAPSAERVLSPAVGRLSGSVAARYAGTRSDVLRLAVPARHAATEKRPSPPAPPFTPDLEAAATAWGPYGGGPGMLSQLTGGGSPRAVWSALPGDGWPALLAHAAAATLASDRGSILCVPDHRDVARLDAALTAVLGPGQHVVLTADAGPARRYRAFLAVARGAARVVVGTRAAAFAPVHDLGLVAVWDDGDDLYAEPRAPYPHTREVLLLRSHEEGTAALVGGFARTVEAEYLLRTGWATEVAADRAVLRRSAPTVSITGATDRELERDPHARTARLPHTAYDAIRDGLTRGPVLLQTPRQGYLMSLACDSCRTPARCATCAGPLQMAGALRHPSCRWCGTEQQDWSCPECTGRGLRAPVLGERRTAEEVGRAFPRVPVRTSAGDRVLATVEAVPSLVVATPGAEPVVEGGYACVVLLDTWLTLARTDLRTGEEALRRWLAAAALARPAAAGGRVVAVGEPSSPALQALLRWDPAGFARRELEERQSAHLPPASRLATLTAPLPDLTAALACLELPPGSEVLGPAPVATDRSPPPGGGTARTGPSPPAGGADIEQGAALPQRAVLRVPRAAGPALSRTLVEMQGVRSARKLSPVRVQVDPFSLG